MRRPSTRLFLPLLSVLLFSAAAVHSTDIPKEAQTTPDAVDQSTGDDALSSYLRFRSSLDSLLALDAASGAENGPDRPASQKKLGAPPQNNKQPALPPELTAGLRKIDDSFKDAEDDQQRVDILKREVRSIGVTFKEPPPPNVSPASYNAISNQVADLLIKLGGEDNNRSSLEVSQRVYQEDRENRDALNNMAGAQYGLGRYQEAVQNASRAAALNKNDERAYTTRALAHYRLGNYTQALEDSQRAVAINPNNRTAFQIAKLTAGRITTPKDLGLDSLSKAAAEEVNREYQTQQQQQNQVVSAANSATAIFTSAGNTASASLTRQAANLIKLEDYQGAIHASSKALERDPKDPEALYLRAAARNMTGEYQKAVDDASTAFALDPMHHKALDARTAALLRLGRYREALTDADLSISMDPKNAYAYKNRAEAKEKIGDLGGMIADYRIAAKLGPQFESELREIAAKHNFRIDITLPKDLPADDGQAAADRKPGRRDRKFMVILVSSLTGGMLIAFGLVHVVLGGRSKLRNIAAKLPGGTRAADARAAGPRLRAAYKILGTLGNGGMGVVFEAEDKALGRKVAIKKMREEIHQDERERARFLEEARIVAALHHPNIVDIHTILEDEGELYLVFEHVEGQTINQILEKKKRLTLKEAQYVLRGVANALEFSHKKGVIHRDLKPSNIMVTKDGMVKVMDFGIARQAHHAEAASTHTRTIAGTPQYMAPEQEEGEVRKESDVFSLGACLYEMVTGENPYPGQGTTASKINKRYQRPTRMNSGLPPEIDALIDDCLEPDPEKRLPSVGEFRRRLDAIKTTGIAAA